MHCYCNIIARPKWTNCSCVGKTTLSKKICSIISENGVKTFGFYTEEVRRNRIREGFDVVTLDAHRGRLARDQSLLDFPTNFKVGKYGVLVEEFEKIALPSLSQPEEPRSLLVIDEIGKMEFFSEPFKSRIREIFTEPSNYVVLATIPVRKSHAIIENIRNHSSGKVWMVTKENREFIHEEILNTMKEALTLK